MEIVKAQKIAYEVVAQLQPFCSKIEVALNKTYKTFKRKNLI